MDDLFGIESREPQRLLAVCEDGQRLLYGDAQHAGRVLGRAMGGRALVFLLCDNSPGSLLGYLGCLQCGAVPLLLDAHTSPPLLASLIDTYQPAYCLVPQSLPAAARAVLPQASPLLELAGSLLLPCGGQGPALHPELCLLLTTSGSTGSPKLVRLSKQNLAANAASIAQYLELDETERPITVLPMSYSYGMSILNSHVLVGASLLLTDRSVLEQEFWQLASAGGATSLAGVPYTYQMYRRLGLSSIELPGLRYLTQAGGKLPEELHREFAAWAHKTGRRFYVMYGQTEASPRMGYLPAARALDKCGSMGLPVPGGRFWLEDAAGGVIDAPGEVGELVYAGKNVGLGYAQAPADLAKGDEWGGVLRTGDMAKRDAEGFYTIVGRKKRFLKLFGNRVNLDEAERLLAARFAGVQFACAGRDDRMAVYFALEGKQQPDLPGQVQAYLAAETRLPARAFAVCGIDAIPKSPAGKTLYAALPPV